MTNRRLIQCGKRLAFFLRHDKGYSFDEHGKYIAKISIRHGTD